ncbi:MAG: PEGA domain-containing protein [Deltaproteobacteria bacterium]|nr:PEGA domain-containing protein [Deltaproteobacteria bacterium]
MRIAMLCVLLICLGACAGRGKTVIRSDPPTAYVSVNGVSEGVTPLEIELDCDKNKHFEVVVSLPGYLPESREISCRRFLGRRKDLFVRLKAGEDNSEKPLPAALPPTKKNFGTIEVKAFPSGSEVFLDDTYLGTTPITKGSVDSGEHVVEVRKNGFQPWKKTFDLKPGAKRIFSPILEEE